MTAETSRKWRDGLAAAAIAAAVIAVFGRSLHYPFVDWDDHIFVLHDNIRYWFDTDWYTRLTTPHAGYPVPVPTAVYGFLHHFVGEEQVWAFNLVNIAAHTLNAVLVYVLFRRLKLAIFTAVAASLLWAIHPVMAEPVAWATGLKDILSMTGVLLGLLGMTVLERKGSTPLAWGLLFIGPLLAIGGKPTGVVIGPMLIAYALLRFDWASARMKLGTAAGAVWTVVGLATAAWSFIAHESIGGQQTEVFSFGRIFLALETMLRNYVLPVNLSAVYSDFPQGPVAVTYILGIGLIAVAAALIWKTRTTRPLVALGVAWLAIAVAPVSNVIPLGRFVADSYLYTPSLGIALAIAAAIGTKNDENPDEKYLGLLRVLAVVGLVALGVVATIQTSHWQSDLKLWEQAYKRAPEQPMAYVRLGNIYFEEERYREAIEVFEELNEQFPNYPITSTNWAMSYCMLGAVERCFVILEQLVERGPGSTSPMLLKRDWHHLLATYAMVCHRIDCDVSESLDEPIRRKIHRAVEMFDSGYDIGGVRERLYDLDG